MEDKEIRLHLQQRKNYTEIELINILYQLTQALLFMQEKLKISHRDIKPQNILTFNNSIYKLADFGEAKEVKISKQLNTLRGTELYMSPALYDGLKNEKDDSDDDDKYAHKKENEDDDDDDKYAKKNDSDDDDDDKYAKKNDSDDD